MARRYTIKILIDGLWRYYRSYDNGEHAEKKFDELKDLFDATLIEDGKIIRNSKL